MTDFAIVWSFLITTLALAIYLKFLIKKIKQIKNIDFEEIRFRYALKLNRFYAELKNFRPIIPKLVEYCKISERAQGNIGKLFGAFIIAYCLFPQLFVNYKAKNSTIWFLIRESAAVVCVFLILKDKLPQKFKKYSGIFYYFALIVSLPLNSSYLYLYSAGSNNTLVNLVFSLMILAFFIEEQNYVASLAIGYFFGFILFLLSKGFNISSLIHIFNNDFKSTVFFVTVSFVFGFLFSRTTKVKRKKLLQSAEAMAGIVAHEVRTPLAEISAETSMLKQSLEIIENTHNLLKEKNTFPAEFEENHLERAKLFCKNKEQKISNTETLIDIVLQKVKQKNSLNEFPVKLNIKDCVEEAIATYPYIDLQKDPGIIKVDITNNFEFSGTKSLVIHIIYNIFKNAYKAMRIAHNKAIRIYTSKKFGLNCLIIEDTGIGIPRDKLLKVTEKFASYWNKGSGLGLALCKDAMRSMHGYIDVESQEKKYTRIILSFPSFVQSNFLIKQPSLRKSPKNVCLLGENMPHLEKMADHLKERINFDSLVIKYDSLQALREINDIYYNNKKKEQIAAIIGSPEQGDKFFTHIQDLRIKRIWLTDGKKDVEENPYVHVSIDKNAHNVFDLIAQELD